MAVKERCEHEKQAICTPKTSISHEYVPH